MENRYELSKDISADGDKTRALLVQQYEATLNRQLADANAAVIALQTKLDNGAVARGVEVTTTNNINQMQQQQQQQQQWGQLYNAIWALGQIFKLLTQQLMLVAAHKPLTQQIQTQTLDNLCVFSR